MYFWSKKLIRFAAFLLIGTTLFISCKNGFLSSSDAQGGSISIVLPGAGRAALDTQDFNFSVLFRNLNTKAEKTLTGKTGETITYKNARPGEYEIIAQAFDNSGKLCYEGHEKATVRSGSNTDVTIALLRILRLWTINDDYEKVIQRYFKEQEPDKVILEIKKFDDTNEYLNELEKALKNNAIDAPDLFTIEDPALLQYTQGDMESYTLPYESLGITQSQINDAQIYSYITQMGTGKDGKIHGLGYQSTACAMIYNKSIAQMLETNDILDGTGSTEEKLHNKLFDHESSKSNLWYLFSLARDLGDKYLVSSYDDIWRMYHASYSKDEYDENHLIFCPWLDEDKNLILEPLPKSFLEEHVSPPMSSEAFTCHNTVPWSTEWYSDMSNDKVFAYFAPAWFISYCLENANVQNDKWGIIDSPVPFTWGGSFLMVNKNLPEVKKNVTKRLVEWITLDTSSNGLMYKIASESSEAVTSQKVMQTLMRQGKGSCAILGGKNILTIYDNASENIRVNYKTPYDATIDEYFMRTIRDEKNYGLPRESTLMKFESKVYKELGFKGNDIKDTAITLTSGDGLPDSNLETFKAEPCSQGIKFTLIFTKRDTASLTYYFAENFRTSFPSYYIRNTEDGYAMFLKDLLTANLDNFYNLANNSSVTITCIYPLNLNENEYYTFDLNYEAQAPAGSNNSDEYVTIPFIVKAGGGQEYVTIKDVDDGIIKIKGTNKNGEQSLEIEPVQGLSAYYLFKNGVTDKYLDVKMLATDAPDQNKYTNDHFDLNDGMNFTIDLGTDFIRNLYYGVGRTNFHAEVAVNFEISGYENLRFRLPPIRSKDYLADQTYVNEETYYIIIDPEGHEIARQSGDGA